MDFECIKGVICWENKLGKVVLDYKFEHTNRELESCLPAKEEHWGCLYR
jgi:hypothetical protein